MKVLLKWNKYLHRAQMIIRKQILGTFVYSSDLQDLFITIYAFWNNVRRRKSNIERFLNAIWFEKLTDGLRLESKI